MTNADKIRAMSNEELAKFIPRHSKCPPNVLFCPYGLKNCDLCWFNWLRMEANDEN